MRAFFPTLSPTLVFLVLSALQWEARAAAAADQPNVLLLLADDAGWGDYGANGNTMVKTPHIDSISRQGATLDAFFVCPVCSPTRAELLTGRWFPRTGVRGVSTGQERMNLDETTLAEVLKSAGYATGIFGKWHNGSQWPYHPMARGFDTFFGYTSGHWGEYENPPLEQNGQPVRAQGYIVDKCTDQALDFMRKQLAESESKSEALRKPFFCYVPFTTPHSPWKVPAEDWDRWKDREISQRSIRPGQENLDQTRVVMAMLENQDRNVGRLLSFLAEKHLEENTVVVYLSDNGPNTWRWNGGVQGKKGGTDEGSHKSPFFLRWPGKVKPGLRVPKIASSIDLLPTLASLLHITAKTKHPLDGRDLSPLLLTVGELPPWPERSLFTAWGKAATLRTQRWRLAGGQLFDLQAEPSQQTPCTDQHPEVWQDLTKQLAAWRLETGFDQKSTSASDVDPRPISAGYPVFPRTWLPARDGTPSGQVRRSANAPNSSYFVNWQSKEDKLTWKLDVVTAGDYTVELEYTCPMADAGATVEMRAKNAILTAKVTPGWDPPLYTNQDTIPRDAVESRMKEFHPLPCGKMHLEAGLQTLTLQATEIPGKSVMDLLSVTLTLTVK